jgi:hypothetical protein
MFRKNILALLFLTIPPLLLADETVRLRVVVDGQTSEVIINTKRDLQRIEFVRRHRIVFINNCKTGEGLMADFDLGVFSRANRYHWPSFSELLLLNSMLPYRFPPSIPVTFDVTDSSDRKNLLGMEARRKILRPRNTISMHKATKGSYKVETLEDQIDAWFVEHPFENGCNADTTTGLIGTSSNTALGRDSFPVQWRHLTRTKIHGADGVEREVTNLIEIEVTSLSKDELDNRLFALPRHFRKVEDIDLRPLAICGKAMTQRGLTEKAGNTSDPQCGDQEGKWK